jgi:hypothetical protein
MPGARLLFLVNEASFFVSHRLPIAIAAQATGYQVTVACPSSDAVATIKAAGLRHVPIRGRRGRAGVPHELAMAASVLTLLWRERPHLVHLITAKPILYGGFAARLLSIPAVAAVSGMGYIFTRSGKHANGLRALIIAGYRLALHRPGAFAIFQNEADRALFRDKRLTWPGHDTVFHGSGTDLDAFDPAPPENGRPLVVLPARMLRDKGVFEFVEAARLLQARG